MQTIDKLREKIDGIDNKLLKLLDSRFEICQKIGELKAQSGKNVTDSGRESFIYYKISSSRAKYKKEITSVFSQIITESKNIQNTDNKADYEDN